jgi:DNA-binding CsgD family transcriptional regulator/transposase
MPRKRSVIVRERIEHLRRLERTATEESTRIRLAVLRTLKEAPQLTLCEVAREVGSSERTVKRWLATYQQSGLQGLLGLGSHATIPVEVESEVAARLNRAEFKSASEVRAWLRTEHGINTTLTTVVSLLNRCASIGTSAKHSSDNRKASDPKAAIALWLLRFLESLPEHVTTREWTEHLRSSLADVLNVDRVSIAINVVAAHGTQGATKGALSIAEAVEGGTAKRTSVSVRSVRQNPDRGRDVLADMKRSGLDLSDFHDPIIEEFTLSDGTFLGTIIFLQGRHRKPITEETRSTIASMRSILTRLLFDCSARHEAQQTDPQQFYNVLRRAFSKYNLTQAEQRCVTLMLLGHRRKEIADDLNTTLDNVAKHLTSVYRKTGTDSFHSLTTLFFGPRL